MRWSLPLLLIACGDEATLSVSHTQAACADPDVEESFSIVKSQDETITATHDGVVEACSAAFAPVVDYADGVLTIREYWEDGADVDCDACFTPTVEVSPFSEREIEVHWVIGDADLADHVEVVELR